MSSKQTDMADYTLKVVAESGYESETEGRCTAEQYGAAMAVLHGNRTALEKQLLEVLTIAAEVAQHEDGCRWFEVPLHRMSSEEGRADADARCNCWKRQARAAILAAGAQQ